MVSDSAILREVETDLQKEHRLAIEAEHTRRSIIYGERRQKAREKLERKLMQAEERQMLQYLIDHKLALEKEEEDRKLAAEKEEEPDKE